MGDHDADDKERELATHWPSLRGITHKDFRGNQVTTRSLLPFFPPNRILAESLFIDFAVPAQDWLLGKDKDSIPAMKANSNWEVALTLSNSVEGLALAHEMGLDPFEDEDEIRSKNQIMVRWLIENQQQHSDHTGCWDHSPWDTAVILRAIAGETTSGNHKELVPALPGVPEAIRRGLLWIVSRFYDAKTGRMTFHLNTGELAESGRTIAELAMSYPSLVDEAVSAIREDIELDELLNEIARNLLRRQTERKIHVSFRIDDIDHKTGVWWDDFFGTASTLMFFSRLLELDDKNICEVEQKIIGEIQISLSKCFLLIEALQSEGGLWGAYADTITLLSAYVKVGAPSSPGSRAKTVSDDLLTRPRVVFRALRWMCDPTQIMDDNSLLHTSFLTTFFVQAIYAVIRFWPQSSETILQVYDELSLIQDRGDSQDRADYLAVALQRDKTEEDLRILTSKHHNTSQELQRERTLKRRVMMTATTLILVLPLALLFAQLSNSISASIELSDPPLFWTIVTLVFSLWGVWLQTIWTSSDN